MRRWPVGALILFFFLPHLAPQPRRRVTAPPEFFRAFEHHEREGNLARVVLRNGLTILVEEHPLRPLAAVVTYLREGDPHPAGVSAARLLHHFKSQEFAERIAALGGQAGGALEAEGQYFLSVVADQNLEKALEVHAGLLALPSLSEEGIAREGAFLARRHGKEPVLEVEDESARLLALRSPSPPPSGELPDLAELERWQGQLYRPGNVILAISGTALSERVLQKAVELLAPLRPSESMERPEPSRVTGGGASGFQYSHRRLPVTSPVLILEYPAPGPRHSDFPLLQLLTYLVGKGTGSALEMRLKKEGALLDADSLLEVSSEGGSRFCILLRPVPDKVDRVEVAALGELEAIREVGVPAGQLERSKLLWLQDYYLQMEKLEGRALQLAFHESLGNFRGRDRLPERVAGVKDDDLRRVIGQYLDRKNLHVHEFFPPEAEARTFTVESFQETLDLLVPEEASKRRGEIQGLKARAGDSFQIPRFTVSYTKIQPRKTSILRGPDIYLLEEHSTPLVRVGFFYPGGRVNETSQNAGITELYLRCLLAQAGRPSTGFSWEELERLGGRLERVNAPDFFGVQVTAVSRGTEELVGLLVKWLRDPAIAEEEFGLQKERLLQEVRRRRRDSRLQALSRARAALFGNHPYALSPWGSEESLSDLTFEEVQFWGARHLGKVHPLLVVQGDVEGTSFLQRFISQLSDVRFEVRKAVQRPLWEEGRPDFVSETAGGVTVFAFPAAEASSYDVPLLQVIRRLVAAPGGALWSELQTEKKLVDGVQVWSEHYVNGGTLLVLLSGPGATVAEARAEAQRLMAEMAERPLPETRFLNAVVGAITDFHILQQDGGRSLLELVPYALVRDAADLQERYLGELKRLTREEVGAEVRNIFRLQAEPSSQPAAVEAGVETSEE